MKKFYISIITIASIFFTSFIFAATTATTNNGYYSSLHPKKMLAATVLGFPSTNITVINYTQETINAAVKNPQNPYGPDWLSDFVLSGNSDTIKKDGEFGDTLLVLRNSAGNEFFRQGVCRRALVIVDIFANLYHTDVDRRFC